MPLKEMLLTDEEIKKLPKFLTSMLTTRPEVVARAQLKKVVEETKSRTNKNFFGFYVTVWQPDEWQSLLDEVKDATE